jgi:hypothetical protein
VGTFAATPAPPDDRTVYNGDQLAALPADVDPTDVIDIGQWKQLRALLIAVRDAVPEAGAPARTYTKRTITGDHTLLAADAVDMVIHSTAAAAHTITLPQDSAAAIAQEVPIPWRIAGTGQATFAAGAGATIQSRGNVFKSAGQHAEGTFTKTAANTWLITGDIVA